MSSWSPSSCCFPPWFLTPCQYPCLGSPYLNIFTQSPYVNYQPTISSPNVSLSPLRQHPPTPISNYHIPTQNCFPSNTFLLTPVLYAFLPNASLSNYLVPRKPLTNTPPSYFNYSIPTSTSPSAPPLRHSHLHSSILTTTLSNHILTHPIYWPPLSTNNYLSNQYSLHPDPQLPPNHPTQPLTNPSAPLSSFATSPLYLGSPFTYSPRPPSLPLFHISPPLASSLYHFLLWWHP